MTQRVDDPAQPLAVLLTHGRQVLPDPAEAVLLTQLIAGLDPQRRAAFVLTQLLGLSYAEAAEVCGCQVGPSVPGWRGPRADLTSQLHDSGLAPVLATAPTSDQAR